MRVYLSGPMTNVPQTNFPAFIAATKELRERGFEVVSPVEMDIKDGITTEAGDLIGDTMTWGDLLSRDVKLIADGGIQGIVFLPAWEKSRGARLEATVGLLQEGFSFFQYKNGRVGAISRREVAWRVFDEVSR